jgi:pimeloyl-ACP methyl ester carboxylesterase
LGLARVGLAAVSPDRRRVVEQRYLYDIERDESLTGEEKEKALQAKMNGLRAAVREGKANPWFAFFLTYMPLPTAKRVTCPVLIIHGDKDAHVPVEHAHYLAQAIRSNGNPDVTVNIFESINHPFLPDMDGRKRGYLKLLREGARVPDSVLDTITAWLVDRLRAGR